MDSQSKMSENRETFSSLWCKAVSKKILALEEAGPRECLEFLKLTWTINGLFEKLADQFDNLFGSILLVFWCKIGGVPI